MRNPRLQFFLALYTSVRQDQGRESRCNAVPSCLSRLGPVRWALSVEWFGTCTPDLFSPCLMSARTESADSWFFMETPSTLRHSLLPYCSISSIFELNRLSWTAKPALSFSFVSFQLSYFLSLTFRWESFFKLFHRVLYRLVCGDIFQGLPYWIQ